MEYSLPYLAKLKRPEKFPIRSVSRTLVQKQWPKRSAFGRTSVRQLLFKTVSANPRFAHASAWRGIRRGMPVKKQEPNALRLPRLRAGRTLVRQLLFIISHSKPACKIQIVKKQRFPINMAKTTTQPSERRRPVTAAAQIVKCFYSSCKKLFIMGFVWYTSINICLPGAQEYTPGPSAQRDRPETGGQRRCGSFQNQNWEKAGGTVFDCLCGIWIAAALVQRL